MVNAHEVAHLGERFQPKLELLHLITQQKAGKALAQVRHGQAAQLGRSK